MSDFRIPLAATDFEVELDWHESRRAWLASEREFGLGLGSPWVQGITPTSAQLKELLRFFVLEGTEELIARLEHLSPGELVALHAEGERTPLLKAKRCSRCGEHWYVLKRETAEEDWLVYGRTCGFSWRRGDPLTDADLHDLLDVVSPEGKE